MRCFVLSTCPPQISPGGGFGPVADDGYGVSHMVASEDEVRASSVNGTAIAGRLSAYPAVSPI